MPARTSADVRYPLTFGGNVNRRVQELLGRYGQAPDPPAQGETPSRPSAAQVAFYILPGGGFWEEPRMGAKLAQGSRPAATARGDFIPDDERNNIDRPPNGTVSDSGGLTAPALIVAEAMPGA